MCDVFMCDVCERCERGAVKMGAKNG